MDASERGSYPPTVTAATELRRTLFGTVDARTTHSGQVVLPCIPAPLEHYLEQLGALFEQIGKPLSAEELGQLRELLAENLEQGFRAGPGAKLVVGYETTVTPLLRKNLACNVAVAGSDRYQGWGQAEEGDGAPFGTYADARVMLLVEELGDPGAARVLDVGAGTGRNALPLARRGHPVDAVEPIAQFAEELRRAARAEELALNVIAADFFDCGERLADRGYRLALLAEVVSHFRSASQLRELFERMCDHLTGGGLLLFNAFLTVPGYEPDDLARQMAEVAWSTMFTRDELAEAMTGLPLELLSEESVVTYEQEHLPESAWPPTSWFVSWATGRAVFPVREGRPPVDLRWILLRRS